MSCVKMTGNSRGTGTIQAGSVCLGVSGHTLSPVGLSEASGGGGWWRSPRAAARGGEQSQEVD